MEDDFAQRQPDDGFDDGLFWSNGNAGKNQRQPIHWLDDCSTL
jgi:hypothetical protein